MCLLNEKNVGHTGRLSSSVSEQSIVYSFADTSMSVLHYIIIQLVKAYRIKFQKFAAHAHKDALINETFIPT